MCVGCRFCHIQLSFVCCLMWILHPLSWELTWCCTLFNCAELTCLVFFFPEVLGLLVVGGQRWIFVLLGVLGVGFGCGFVFVRGLLFLILYGYLQFFYALCKEQCLTERLVTQD